MTVAIPAAASGTVPVISITDWPRNNQVAVGSDGTFTVTRSGDVDAALEWDFAITLLDAGASMPSPGDTNSLTLRDLPVAFAAGSATATGRIAAGGLTINGDGGAGQRITVTLLPPDHGAGTHASKLVAGSYTVPGSGDGLTRSYTYVAPGPQPVDPVPTPRAAVQGSAYSLSLDDYFTNPDSATLTFTIGTGTCTGFAISGDELVGVGTSPANSVTASANTPCTITASDGTNTASMVSFTIPVTVPAANAPPVPVDDPIAIDGDDASVAVTARNMGVLANDTDDGDATKLVVTNFEQALSASGVYEGLSATTAGSALRILFLGTTTPDLTNGQKVADFTLNENGTYTLALVDSVFDHLLVGETELFYVLYEIRDEEMALNAHRTEGLITITVNGAVPAPNAAPEAAADAYTISSDIDAANSGTRRVVFTAGNVITGDPNSANAGADMDDEGASNLRVTFYAGGEDVAAAIGNDEQATATATFNTNLNASVANVISAGEPPRMRIQMQTNGDFRLIMPADDSRYEGLSAGSTEAEKFSYRIADMGSPVETDDGVLTITITGVNDDPVPPSGFNGDTSIVAATGTPETVTVPAFTDADANDTLTYTYAVTLNGAAVTPAPTWLTVDSTDLVFTVGTPPANTLATGVDSAAYVVTVTATDSQSATATVQFTVTVTRTANAIPTVTAVTGTATEGLNGAAGASAIPNLLDNAADADTGDTLTVSRYTAGSDINMGAQTAGNSLAGTHGMLNITAAGVVTYTPNDSLGAGDVTDTFLFEVADNKGGRSTPATLTITVTGVNDSPVPPSGFNGDRSIVASDTAGTPETVTVPAFTDPESDTLTISHAVTLNGAAVTPTWLMVDSTGLVFTVSTPPATTTTGDYEVTVTATDGTSAPATFQFTITVTDSPAPTNAAPMVVGNGIDNMTITVGDVFNYAIMTGATGDFHDTDDTTLTYALTSVNPAAPWMSLTTAGVFGGTAVAGTYTVTVTASDDETPTPASITDTFTLTVAPANNAPVAPTIPNQTVTVGAMFSFVVPAFTDPDGDTLTYTVADHPSWLNFDATTRTLSGTAAAGGPHTLTVTATDDGTPVKSATRTFTLTVAPQPAAPTTPVEVQMGDTSPTTGGVVLDATAFGYLADDSRLTSITITTLPDAATEGTLYLNGTAVAVNPMVTRGCNWVRAVCGLCQSAGWIPSLSCWASPLMPR